MLLRFITEARNQALKDLGEYVELTTELNSLPDKHGKTAHDVANFIIEQSGGEDVDPRLIRLLEIDVDSEFISMFKVFSDLSKRKQDVNKMLQYSEILAYCTLTKTELSKFELDTINTIDYSCLKGLGNRRRELNNS